MSRARLIPCLLMKNRGLYKTIKFSEPKYLGDPMNAVRIFNEMKSDELVIYDIGKTNEHEAPDFDYLAKLASECKMPLSYGGGVRTVEHALRLVDLGIEKISFSSVIYENMDVIGNTAAKLGKQSVIATLDVDLRKGILKSGYFLTSRNNSIQHKAISLQKKIKDLITVGVGEIVINTVHRDGTMQGHDSNLLSLIFDEVDIPITILGGISSLEEINRIVDQYKHIGIGVGSLFVYRGKYKAVLINYPSVDKKFEITRNREERGKPLF